MQRFIPVSVWTTTIDMILTHQSHCVIQNVCQCPWSLPGLVQLDSHGWGARWHCAGCRTWPTTGNTCSFCICTTYKKVNQGQQLLWMWDMVFQTCSTWWRGEAKVLKSNRMTRTVHAGCRTDDLPYLLGHTLLGPWYSPVQHGVEASMPTPPAASTRLEPKSTNIMAVRKQPNGSGSPSCQQKMIHHTPQPWPVPPIQSIAKLQYFQYHNTARHDHQLGRSRPYWVKIRTKLRKQSPMLYSYCPPPRSYGVEHEPAMECSQGHTSTPTVGTTYDNSRKGWRDHGRRIILSRALKNMPAYSVKAAPPKSTPCWSRILAGISQEDCVCTFQMMKLSRSRYGSGSWVNGIKVTTAGAHVWCNWRRNVHRFFARCSSTKSCRVQIRGCTFVDSQPKSCCCTHRGQLHSSVHSLWSSSSSTHPASATCV